ncbi:hypothetical protein DUI87_06326 [Hirundo rustica rustica]|uniref:RNase H type-1 domain-containing protein n=1 Tax=Hirundo rustica rustica TaxID=333673 RepID=A0A3M0KU72_HIRRU|nr:hypothetical protein DUI87_06326 [Hirundo rustica rustica]
MVSTHARASSGTVVWKGTDSWPCQLTRSCGALDPTRPRQQAQVVQGNDGGDRNADSAEWVTRFNWSPSVGPPDLQDREGTIYTDSKYAFGVVHTFRKNWKERGLMNTQRKGLVHQGLIIQILKALKSPKKIAVVHVKGHQKMRGIKTRRNNLADDEAKKAALRENSNGIMTFQEAGTQNQTPYFSLAEVEAMKNLGATLKEGQWILPDKTTVQMAEKG